MITHVAQPMWTLRKITQYVSLAWVSISACETSCNVFRKRTPTPPPCGWWTNVKSSPHNSDMGVISSSSNQVSVKEMMSTSRSSSSALLRIDLTLIRKTSRKERPVTRAPRHQLNKVCGVYTSLFLNRTDLMAPMADHPGCWPGSP